MPTIEDERNEDKKNAAAAGLFAGFIGLIVIAWVLAGIIAFIMSIVCFGYSGSTTDHVVGLVLATFFGPFYWLFYYFAPNYCKTVSAAITSLGVGGKRRK